jgi:uncharacterized protein (TIGR03435 family)
MRVGVLLIFVTGGAVAVSAQLPRVQPSADRNNPPGFEVVSIRRNVSNTGFGLTYTVDGFSMTDLPVRAVIVNAYGLHDQELIIGGKLIAGGPGWINSDRYDIRAKMSQSDSDRLQKLGEDQRLVETRRMLQAMLADRFKLKVHSVPEETAGYSLLVGDHGPKLKESVAAAPPESAPDAEATPSRGGLFAVPGTITSKGGSMAQLAFVLTGALHSPVTDRTGLTGAYDFTLKYSPDDLRPPDGSGTPSDSSGPSVFTAVREQLGLKLQRGKGSMETIVIDFIEKPSEN